MHAAALVHLVTAPITCSRIQRHIGHRMILPLKAVAGEWATPVRLISAIGHCQATPEERGSIYDKSTEPVNNLIGYLLCVAQKGAKPDKPLSIPCAIRSGLLVYY